MMAEITVKPAEIMNSPFNPTRSRIGPEKKFPIHRNKSTRLISPIL